MIDLQTCMAHTHFSSPRFDPRRSTRPARLALIVASSVICLFIAAGSAAALGFQVVFSNSTYDTQVGDTFSDLLAQHQSESVIQSSVTTGLENVSTAVYGGGVTRDYSMLMTTTVDISMAGTYTFQVGTDWGRGGATALIDNATGSILSERVLDTDIWWANDFNNPDVFTTTFNFNVGDSYTLAWVGFEGCCGGSSALRFSFNGGGYAPLNEANFRPYSAVPEPGPLVLLCVGLTGLASIGRKSKPNDSRSTPTTTSPPSTY